MVLLFFRLIVSIFSYKDCPAFDLDKLLEDVQNGLYPITAYHLLYPTLSSLTVPSKTPSVSEKNLTSSTSSLSSLVSTSNDNDLTTPIQSVTDPSFFLGANTIDSTVLINSAMKSRAGTMSSVGHHERSGSIIGDSEIARRDSQSLSNGTNPPASSASTLTDDRESRRLIDVQCRVKTKDTGLCMVNRHRHSFIDVTDFPSSRFQLYISVKFPDRLQRDMTTEIDQDESATTIVKELLDLGLIHEVNPRESFFLFIVKVGFGF